MAMTMKYRRVGLHRLAGSNENPCLERSGLGSVRLFRTLLSLKQQHNPTMIFLVETKSNHVLLESIRVKLGFGSKLVFDCKGRSGGLCLYWSLEVCLDLLSYSWWHIDVRISSHRSKLWRFTGFYGHLEGGQERSRQLMENCRNTLDSCDMVVVAGKLRGCGQKLSASNVANKRVLKREIPAKRKNYVWGGGKLRRRFHFESCWAEREDCKQLVTNYWGTTSDSCDMVVVAGKLRGCGQKLSAWNVANKRVLKREIPAKRKNYVWLPIIYN
ncbi:hypothetical protein Dsin_008643 [Dipteronia sinensis]|uniref:Uncharacterized protein n=1 Tax=Dipteronia sinensis TaxID=43782 RepID=A0AAE0EAV3_9ROSI|nr:hypothetical protein Dsin_008643 [Dipteronia sinensis]